MALDVTRRVGRGALLSRELGRSLDRACLEGRERSLVTDLTYGVARWRIWLDAALAPHLAQPAKLPEGVRAILRLGSYERLKRGTPAHAAVHAWVDACKRHAPRFAGLVNAVLRRVTPPDGVDAATLHALPAWLWSTLEHALGEDAAGAVDAMREPAPLWFATFGTTARHGLEAAGAEVHDGPVAGTIRVRTSQRPGDLPGFRDGALQPLNPMSALVTHALPAGVGDHVLDLCAGRGIKTALLAARGCRVTAIERDAGKVEQARRNLERLHLNAVHLTRDLTATPSDVEPAARVLLDAPCSGTGTLRGHPEIVERLTVGDLSTLARTQRALLETAYTLTEPGGTLVYGVCSLTAEEGPDVIAGFLEDHPDVQVVPVAWQDLAPSVKVRDTGVGTFLVPTAGLDGFFVARMTRNAL